MLLGAVVVFYLGAAHLMAVKLGHHEPGGPKGGGEIWGVVGGAGPKNAKRAVRLFSRWQLTA